jgi:addiction module HigA family antidote
MTHKLPPIHPGEILKETLGDLGISMNRLAQALHVPANRISSLVAGQRAITGETALRLIGSTCRPSMISKPRATNGMPKSSPKYAPATPPKARLSQFIRVHPRPGVVPPPPRLAVNPNHLSSPHSL